MTEDIAAYVGVDWASATHYVYALDAQGAKLGHHSFQHSGEGLAWRLDPNNDGRRARAHRRWKRTSRRELDGVWLSRACLESKAT